MKLKKTQKTIPLLILSAIANDLETLKRLLNEGADVNVQDHEGRRALHQASSNKNVEMAQLLIKRQADVNAPDLYGFVPLHFAAQEYAIDLAKLFLKNGASVDAQTRRCLPQSFIRVAGVR